MMDLEYRRTDGSFVALVDGLPYHVTKDDPLYAEAVRATKTVKGGLAIEPAPEVRETTESDYSAAIQSLLDGKARERQYDGIASAISYRGDNNAIFASEAEALFAWRSAVWTYAQAELSAVKSGARPQPTIADFLHEIETRFHFEWS